jgi:hypothetical protein
VPDCNPLWRPVPDEVARRYLPCEFRTCIRLSLGFRDSVDLAILRVVCYSKARYCNTRAILADIDDVSRKAVSATQTRCACNCVEMMLMMRHGCINDIITASNSTTLPLQKAHRALLSLEQRTLHH